MPGLRRTQYRKSHRSGMASCTRNRNRRQQDRGLAMEDLPNLNFMDVDVLDGVKVSIVLEVPDLSHAVYC